MKIIYWWIMYDIATPRRLRRMAKLCRQNGLHRVQKSVYLGKMTQEEVTELRENILQWMLTSEDQIIIVPVALHGLKARISLGDDTALTEILENKAVICL